MKKIVDKLVIRWTRGIQITRFGGSSDKIMYFESSSFVLIMYASAHLYQK